MRTDLALIRLGVAAVTIYGFVHWLVPGDPSADSYALFAFVAWFWLTTMADMVTAGGHRG